MCVTGTLLRGVLVLLLLANSRGKRRCNYKEILGSYREVIFVELQNLNLTGSSDSPKPRDPCPSSKERRILGSILATTQQVRCQLSSKRPSELERPLESMEQLILNNCNLDYLGSSVSCSAARKIRGKKRKRMRLIKAMEALVTCWQKLQTVRALDK